MFTRIEHGDVQDLSYLNEFAGQINTKINDLIRLLYQGKQNINIPTILYQNKNMDNYYYIFTEVVPENSITIFDNIVYLNRKQEIIKFPIFYPSNFVLGYIPIDLKEFDNYFWSMVDIELNDDDNIRNTIQEILISKDVYIKDSPYFDGFSYTFDNTIHYIKSNLGKPSFVLDGYKLLPQVYDITHDVGYIIIDNVVIQVFTKNTNINYLGIPNQFLINIYSDFGDINSLQKIFIPIWNLNYSGYNTDLSQLQQNIFYNLLSSIITQRSDVYKLFLFTNKFEINNLYIDLFSQFERVYNIEIITNELLKYLMFDTTNVNIWTLLQQYKYQDFYRMVLENIILKVLNNFNSLLDETILQNLQIFLSGLDGEILNSLFNNQFNDLFNSLIDLQFTYNMDTNLIALQISSKILSDDKFQNSLDNLLQYTETYNQDYSWLDNLNLMLNEEKLDELYSTISKNFPVFNLIDLKQMDINTTILLQILNQTYIRDTTQFTYNTLKETFNDQIYLFYKNSYQTQKLHKEVNNQNIVIDLYPMITQQQRKLNSYFWFTSTQNKIPLNTLINNLNNLNSILELDEISNVYNTLNYKQLQFINVSCTNIQPISNKQKYKLVDVIQNITPSKIYQIELKPVVLDTLSQEMFNNYLQQVTISNIIVKFINKIFVLEVYRHIKHNNKGKIKIENSQEIFTFSVNDEIINIFNEYDDYYVINNIKISKSTIQRFNIFKITIQYNNKMVNIYLDTFPIIDIDNFILYYSGTKMYKSFIKQIVDTPFKLPHISCRFGVQRLLFSYPNEIKIDTIEKINNIVNIDKTILSNLCMKDLLNFINKLKSIYSIDDSLINNILTNQIPINDQLMNLLQQLIKQILFNNEDTINTTILKEKIKSLLGTPEILDIINRLVNMNYNIDEILNSLIKYISMLDKILSIQTNINVDINNTSDNMLDILVNTSSGCIS